MRELLKDLGLLALRVSLAASMFFGHGLQKVQNYGKLVEEFSDPLGLGSQFSLILAIFAEFCCSILLAFGLVTRLAVIPLIATMCVALFMVHASDPWQVKELAAIYLAGFAALLLTGPGRFSVDRWLWGKKKTVRETPPTD